MDALLPLTPIALLAIFATLLSLTVRRRANVLLMAFNHDQDGTRDALVSSLLGLNGEAARKRASAFRDAFYSTYPDLARQYHSRGLL